MFKKIRLGLISRLLQVVINRLLYINYSNIDDEYNYIKQFRKEFPDVLLYCKESHDWTNEAVDCLKSDLLEEAKVIFKKLCVAQPNHHDGFLGMAYIYYKEGNIKASKWFSLQATINAKEFLKDRSIDNEVVENIIEFDKRVNNVLEISLEHCFGQ